VPVQSVRYLTHLEFPVFLLSIRPVAKIGRKNEEEHYRLEKTRLTRDAMTTSRGMAATLDQDLAGLETGLRVPTSAR
jgi:hypothetical protein